MPVHTQHGAVVSAIGQLDQGGPQRHIWQDWCPSGVKEPYSNWEAGAWLEQEFNLKGWALVTSFLLGAFKVQFLIHQPNFTTLSSTQKSLFEFSQWWEKPEGDCKSPSATPAGYNNSWYQGLYFWVHLANVQNRWQMIAAMKNCWIQRQGSSQCYQGPMFQVLPCAGWATWRGHGNFPLFQRPEFRAEVFRVSGHALGWGCLTWDPLTPGVPKSRVCAQPLGLLVTNKRSCEMTLRGLMKPSVLY